MKPWKANNMTSGDYTRVHTITALERLQNSVNGNPAWKLTFEDGSFTRTQSDASISYSLPNPEFRDVPLIVSFTRAGRVWNLEPREEYPS